MNEDALRAMIRQAIARHIDAAGEDPTGRTGGVMPAADPSHYRYALPESGGPCLIEPSVPCNHCGYCQSHGH